MHICKSVVVKKTRLVPFYLDTVYLVYAMGPLHLVTFLLNSAGQNCNINARVYTRANETQNIFISYVTSALERQTDRGDRVQYNAAFAVGITVLCACCENASSSDYSSRFVTTISSLPFAYNKQDYYRNSKKANQHYERRLKPDYVHMRQGHIFHYD